MQYADHRILANAQKQFTLQKALKNALPTLRYKLLGKPLPASEKITICTATIFPPLAILWYRVIKQCLGDRVDIVIFDCTGNLDPSEVPTATVQRFLNTRHATKIDTWLTKTTINRKLVWICDDDVFPISEKVIGIIEREFSRPKTATVSLRPRTWWHFEIGDKEYQPSGSYCLVINRKIFAKEKLSAQPTDGNTNPTHTGKKWTRFDTLDKANEKLLKLEYRCAIVPKEERKECTVGFNGTSIAALLLNRFHSADAMLTCLNAVTDIQWASNVFPRCLSALLTADAIRDLYCSTTGKPWPYPNLPTKKGLIALRKKAEPHLSSEHDFVYIDKTTDRLRTILLPKTK